MKKILAFLLFVPLLAVAAEGGESLDPAPINVRDKVSLQRGAAIFVNNCLNCHSASSMRYARLQDLGLTEQQIKDNLLFAGKKVGETMTVAMDPEVAQAAFGVVPPDLSLVGRSRGPDWLYTYLRSFYRDPASKSGWNNTVFPNVAMPHVLWAYQGQQVLQVTARTDPQSGEKIETRKLVLDQPGSMDRLQYDRYVADLVNYLAWMAEPSQTARRSWGIVVMFVLAIFFILAWMLKREYWKDVR
ncbi:MAG TPA: cytochrome c1 [Usitatibacter sp.]|jgi:ubiquinol-cytochrome c reductase cytochrome c1 subunit|nr:cytochrome c1 [Usitatibacter sp.]